jgi:hypothetical protein
MDSSREEPKTLQKLSMQGDGKQLHDSDSECESESRKVHPLNHDKSIKEDCKASPKRDEHLKGGCKTCSPHQTYVKKSPKMIRQDFSK